MLAVVNSIIIVMSHFSSIALCISSYYDSSHVQWNSLPWQQGAIKVRKQSSFQVYSFQHWIPFHNLRPRCRHVRHKRMPKTNPFLDGTMMPTRHSRACAQRSGGGIQYYSRTEHVRDLKMADHSPITAKELAGISLKCLDSSFSEEYAYHLSEFCDRWESIGYRLKLTKSDISSIKDNNSDVEMRKILMLQTRKERFAHKDTYLDLIEALLQGLINMVFGTNWVFKQ